LLEKNGGAARRLLRQRAVRRVELVVRWRRHASLAPLLAPLLASRGVRPRPAAAEAALAVHLHLRRGVTNRGHEPDRGLDCEHARRGVVDASPRHFAAQHGALNVVEEGLPRDGGGSSGGPSAWQHDHVDSGVDGGGEAREGAAPQLVDAAQVGHDESAEAEVLLEEAGEELFVGVHLCAAHRRVRDHHRQHARLHCGAVRQQVLRQPHGVQVRVPLVRTGEGRAVCCKVLCARGDSAARPPPPHEPRPRGREVGARQVGPLVCGRLKAGDRGCRMPAHELLVRPEALVRPPPPAVPRRSDARAKGPVQPRRGHLGRRRGARRGGQALVVCGAEPDVVRQDGGVGGEGVAVDGVDAEEEGDAPRVAAGGLAEAARAGGERRCRGVERARKDDGAGACRLVERAIEHRRYVLARCEPEVDI